MEIRSFDFPGIIEQLQGGKWEECDGRDSGVGLDYWYGEVGGTGLVNVNIDQDSISMTLLDKEDDVEPETILSGTFDELEEDEELGRFFTSGTPSLA